MQTYQLIALTIFLLILGAVAWSWYRRKSSRRKIQFTDAWRDVLQREVRFYQRLNAENKKRFEEDILHFLRDVQITGVDTEVDDTDRLLVASGAVIPLFGFPSWRYRNLNEVLLYEGSFNADYQTKLGEKRNILGMVGSGSMNRMMILSKPSLHRGFEQSGSHNVAIHEFVHLLDKADGSVDGIPEIFLKEPYLIPWTKLIHQEIQDIRQGHSDINPYGGTNEAEFFSVVSEYFFQEPDKLEKNHPELFAWLERVYRQDLG